MIAVRTFSIWCDTSFHSEIPTPGTGNPLSPERSRWRTVSCATSRCQPSVRTTVMAPHLGGCAPPLGGRGATAEAVPLDRGADRAQDAAHLVAQEDQCDDCNDRDEGKDEGVLR